MWTLKETLIVVATAPLLSICCCCLCTSNLIKDLREGLWRNPLYVYGGYCGTNRPNPREDRRREAESKRLASNRPRELPLRRPRRLTLPLDPRRPGLPSIGQWKQRKQSQRQSLFSTLPIEIRRLIYQEIIVGDTPNFRILQKRYQPRLGHLRHAPRPDRVVFDDSWWGRVGTHHDLCHCCAREETDGDLLALLLTCRQTYSEAIDLLYQLPVFEFKDPSTLLAFRPTVLPQRLNAIKAVHLAWEVKADALLLKPGMRRWRQCCEILSKMYGLRQLTVVLQGRVASSDTVRGYMQHLRLIRHVDEFVVGLAWKCDLRMYEDGHAPFLLVKRGP